MTEKIKRLELAEANTADILDRYDNSEYHRMTWSHPTTCVDCDADGILHSDSVENKKPKCNSCGSFNVTLTPYVEIVEYDEAYSW